MSFWKRKASAVGTQGSLPPQMIKVGTSSRLSGAGSSGSWVRARCSVASRLPGERWRAGQRLKRAANEALGLEVDADVADDGQARQPRPQRHVAGGSRIARGVDQDELADAIGPRRGQWPTPPRRD